MYSSYVAIGDSFTEGVGDDLPDGSARGWADFVALGLAHAAQPDTVTYANLAIRGKKLTPIIDEQLEPALALGAELLSFNGGGNDILRPRISITEVSDRLRDAVERARETGIHVLMLSGANPARHLPMGPVFERRGDALAAEVRAWGDLESVTFVDNWSDETLTDIRYWSPDKLHLNAAGHAHAAANVLRGLGVEVPPAWGVDEFAATPPSRRSRNSAAYYRQFVMPWIGRRLTGRSSGDGRTAKRPTLQPVVLA